MTTTIIYFQKNICINQLKNNDKDFFDSIIMLRFGQTKTAKNQSIWFKKPINIWDNNVNNLLVLKSIKTKTNSKYLIGYLDEIIRPLGLTLPKMSEHVKTFKNKGGNKDNKLMHFHINDEKILKKCKANWTKIEDFRKY